MRFFMDYDNIPNQGPLMLFKDNGDGTSSLATPEDVNLAIAEATACPQKLCEEQKGEIAELKSDKESLLKSNIELAEQVKAYRYLESNSWKPAPKGCTCYGGSNCDWCLKSQRSL